MTVQTAKDPLITIGIVSNGQGQDVELVRRLVREVSWFVKYRGPEASSREGRFGMGFYLDGELGQHRFEGIELGKPSRGGRDCQVDVRVKEGLGGPAVVRRFIRDSIAEAVRIATAEFERRGVDWDRTAVEKLVANLEDYPANSWDQYPASIPEMADPDYWRTDTPPGGEPPVLKPFPSVQQLLGREEPGT